MYKDKKVFILGLAKSGYEVAKLLLDEASEIVIVDENEKDPHIQELESLGVKVYIDDRTNQDKYLDNSFDLVIKNPGVPLNAPVVVKANELGIPITNEVEVAFNHFPKGVKVIGITGSNGKTTTTTIIYEILKSAGLPVVLGGNIGIPVSKIVKDLKEGDILVIEISIQQLINFDKFKTNISLVTNLTPTHIDFVGSYDNYKEYKKKIFNNHTKEDLNILNVDQEVLELAKDDIARKITFSTKKKSNIYLDNNTIWYFEKPIINIDEIKLIGNHNYENVMGAVAICKEFNVDNKFIKEFLKDFDGVAHRMQFVKEVNGRLFYNDSKATNTVSTNIALGSFNSPIILLLGGFERNESFEPLLPNMGNVKLVVTYGETKYRIKEFCESNNIKCEVVDVLEQAVKLAYENSVEKDTILLSPSCASWDQYVIFEERGNEFIKVVNELE